MKVIAESDFKGQRLGWMDAVRGVAMLLVVWHHFMIGAFRGMAVGVVETLTLFEVPLFFFVSGFFAWKAPGRWEGVGLRHALGRKAWPLLCGTGVFYALWQLRNGNSVLDFLFEGFWGYWFTVALFQMLTLYMAIVWLARRVGRESVVWWGLGVLTVVTVGAVKVADGFLLTDRVSIVLSWHQVCNCFQFFAAGVVARRLWPGLERLLELRWMFALSVAVFAGIVALCGWGSLPHTAYQLLHGMAMRYAGVVMVVSGFYRIRTAIDGAPVPSRWLRLVGRRTLDIYFMHYFLLPLPSTFPQVVDVLRELAGGSVAISLLVATAGAVAIASVCAGVGGLLRHSRLGSLLLGGR